jgi:hypothetical protein
VQGKERDQGRESNYYEERKTRNPGCMPGLRDKDVQNWKKLELNYIKLEREGHLMQDGLLSFMKL